jgi:chromosomal replication initiation ATPase DnaA
MNHNKQIAERLENIADEMLRRYDTGTTNLADIIRTAAREIRNVVVEVRTAIPLPIVTGRRVKNIADVCKRVVANHHGITEGSLIGSTRARAYAAPRHKAIWLTKYYYDMATLEEIGQCFGGRDHSTILYALAGVRDKMATDSKYLTEMQALMAQVSDTLSADRGRAA